MEKWMSRAPNRPRALSKQRGRGTAGLPIPLSLDTNDAAPDAEPIIFDPTNDGTKIIWPPLPGVRRHAAGLATTRVITLDGADGDWFPIAPIAEGSSSASPLLRFFSMRTYMNASDLFFDITAQSNKNAPTANDDTYSVERGKSLGVNVPGVLANDTDADGDSMAQYQLWDSNPGGGRWVINGIGQLSNTAVTITAAQLAQLLVRSSWPMASRPWGRW